MESGEEEYYPALQVGPVGSSFSVVSTDLNVILFPHTICLFYPLAMIMHMEAHFHVLAGIQCRFEKWLTDFYLCSPFGWISLQSKVAVRNLVTAEELLGRAVKILEIAKLMYPCTIESRPHYLLRNRAKMGEIYANISIIYRTLNYSRMCFSPSKVAFSCSSFSCLNFFVMQVRRGRTGSDQVF